MKFGIAQCGVFDYVGTNDYDFIHSSVQTAMANYNDPKIREDKFNSGEEEY